MAWVLAVLFGAVAVSATVVMIKRTVERDRERKRADEAGDAKSVAERASEELNHQLSTTRRELEAVKYVLDAERNKSARLETQLAEADGKLAAANERAAELERVRKDLSAKLSKVEADNQALVASLLAAETKAAEAGPRVTMLQSRCDALARQIEQLENAIRSAAEPPAGPPVAGADPAPASPPPTETPAPAEASGAAAVKADDDAAPHPPNAAAAAEAKPGSGNGAAPEILSVDEMGALLEGLEGAGGPAAATPPEAPAPAEACGPAALVSENNMRRIANLVREQKKYGHKWLKEVVPDLFTEGSDEAALFAYVESNLPRFGVTVVKKDRNGWTVTVLS